MANQTFSTLLSRVTKNDPTLTSLDFRCDVIDAEGAKALAEALKVNTTLTSLNLWDNEIGDEGAKALAEALKVNKALTSLNLEYNSIGDEGAKALAEALKVNTTLTSLNLGGNLIGNEGAKALAEALKANTTLTSLDFRGNRISVDAEKSIQAMLAINKRLALLVAQEEKKQTDVDALLFSAAATGQLAVIKILVEEYGANLSIENKQGKTAIQIAKAAGHKTACDWLTNKRKSNVEVRKNAWVLAQAQRVGFHGEHRVGVDILINIAALTGNGSHEYDHQIASSHFSSPLSKTEKAVINGINEIIKQIKPKTNASKSNPHAFFNKKNNLSKLSSDLQALKKNLTKKEEPISAILDACIQDNLETLLLSENKSIRQQLITLKVNALMIESEYGDNGDIKQNASSSSQP